MLPAESVGVLFSHFFIKRSGPPAQVSSSGSCDLLQFHRVVIPRPSCSSYLPHLYGQQLIVVFVISDSGSLQKRRRRNAIKTNSRTWAPSRSQSILLSSIKKVRTTWFCSFRDRTFVSSFAVRWSSTTAGGILSYFLHGGWILGPSAHTGAIEAARSVLFMHFKGRKDG